MLFDYEQVVSLHRYIIEKTGGCDGVRDRALLESALARPFCGYYRDCVEQSAALFESLIKNHPFVDGNKRMAIELVDVFLKQNGLQFDIEKQKCLDFFERLFCIKEEKELFHRIDNWLRKNTIPFI